ncbi:hypothetical protein K431DRAFT_22238 [Polychaeton citri CBS 116435]|uniref:Mediator of RNA polymerase II transcription subunit 11 n=1 Tax=Polychaeton citri CBS 116435 TaxID=1314669 RepID=A0A9P4UR12_9PEZI|nr:hypothetical protein K431DRAFT_22238 [Polychaeton citri CBS 116435]
MMSQQTFTAADRIRELSAINSDVASLVKSAGKALTALTDRPIEDDHLDADDEDIDMNASSSRDRSSPATLEDRKQAFQTNTKAYYETLQAVIARLRRQAYALEEAGIIASKAPTLSGKAGVGSSQVDERITNGGLGNLDVGWLNSRGNKVGAEKERELVLEAKELAEKVINEDSGLSSG